MCYRMQSEYECTHVGGGYVINIVQPPFMKAHIYMIMFKCACSTCMCVCVFHMACCTLCTIDSRHGYFNMLVPMSCVVDCEWTAYIWENVVI